MKLNLEPKNIPAEYRILGKQLLADLQSKRITMEEFDKEIAYLSIECGFHELVFKPYPPKPTKLMQYQSLSRIQKEKTNASFWQQKDIAEYNRSYSKAVAHNMSVLSTLQGLLKKFKGYGDPKRESLVRTHLNAFLRHTSSCRPKDEETNLKKLFKNKLGNPLDN